MPASSDKDKFWVDKVIAEQENIAKSQYDVMKVAGGLREKRKKDDQQRTADEVTQNFLNSLHEVDSTFDDLKRKSNFNYYLIVGLNIIMFGIGTVLLGVSISYSLNNAADASKIATIGGLGIADIVAILLVNTQVRIRKMHSDFMQAGVICNTWMQQTQAAWLRLIRNQFSNDELHAFQLALGRYSTTAIKNLEIYTEGSREEEITGKKESEGKPVDGEDAPKPEPAPQVQNVDGDKKSHSKMLAGQKDASEEKGNNEQR